MSTTGNERPSTVPTARGVPRMSIDSAVAVAIFFVAALVGATYCAVNGDYARFEQGNYGPSVMLALGRGYVNPEWTEIPGLRDFLETKTRTLRISSEELPEVIHCRPLNPLHLRERYSFVTVGLLWKLFGISWIVLAPLCGFFYGLTALAAFAMFRLIVNRTLAIVGALIIMFSPINLYFVPHFRDYSKATPILLTVAILGYLIKRKLVPVRLFAICAGLGAMLGIAFGFRKDVIVCIPISLFVIALLIPGKPWAHLRVKCGAAMAFILAFLATGHPMLLGMSEKGGNSYHVIIYGLLPPFDDFLGMGGAPYQIARTSSDRDTYMPVEAYAQRHEGPWDENGGIKSYETTTTYDKMCLHYFLEYAKTFPADLLLRGYAAALRVIEYGPFISSEESRYGRYRIALIENMFNLRWNLCKSWCWMVKYLAVGAFLLLCGLSIRQGFGAALLFFYFTGITCLQFDLRHHFHTEIAFWLILLFSLQCAMRGCAWSLSAECRAHVRQVLVNPKMLWNVQMQRALMMAVLLPVGLLSLLYVTRAYQSGVVGDLYKRYASASIEPLAVERVQSGENKVLFKVQQRPDPDKQRGSDCWDVYPDYYVAEVDASSPVSMFVSYTGREDIPVTLPASSPHVAGQRTKYFFPVYELDARGCGGPRELQGLVFSNEQADQLKGLYRVKDQDQFPLLLDLVLPPQWESLKRWKSLQRDVVPLYVRASRASSRNLLVNGGMEKWTDDGKAPENFNAILPAEVESIQKETMSVAEGHAAVRQVWNKADGAASIFKLFGKTVENLEPSTTYEFYVKASNPSKDHVVIAVWQLTPNANGRAQIRGQLNHGVVRIKPCPTFTEYGGYFTTGPYADGLVMLVASCNGPVFPATVIWDDWRLAKTGGDPWRIPAQAFVYPE